MLEREQLIEIAVAVTAVFVMLGSMIWIGTTYGGNSGVLEPDGAQLLIYAIVGFIFLMTGVGITLAYVLNDPEDGLENDTEDDVEAQNAV